MGRTEPAIGRENTILSRASGREAGGLGFALLSSHSGSPVTIGHANGIITLDLAETLDAHRESLRVRLGGALPNHARASVHDLVVGEGPRGEERGARAGREPDSYWMPTARRALIARVCDPRVKRSMIVPTPNRPSVKTHSTPRPILPR